MMPNMDEIAEQHQLGLRESVHTFRPVKVLARSIFAFVWLVGSLLTLFIAAWILVFMAKIVSESEMLSSYILAGVVLLAGLACYVLAALFIRLSFFSAKGLISLPRYGATMVAVYAEGLIVQQKGHVEIVLWNQIDAVWQSTIRSYTVRRNDRKIFWFSGELTHVQQLGEKIRQRVTRYQLPELLTRYRNGETILFGQLGMNQQGLRWKTHILPWSQFKTYQAKQGRLYFYRKESRLAWKVVPIASIPNVLVLLSLLQVQTHVVP